MRRYFMFRKYYILKYSEMYETSIPVKVQIEILIFAKKCIWKVKFKLLKPQYMNFVYLQVYG